MVILHGFLALLAGFATMAILVIVVTALLTRLAPDWVGQQGKPGAGYIFAQSRLFISGCCSRRIHNRLGSLRQSLLFMCWRWRL